MKFGQNSAVDDFALDTTSGTAYVSGNLSNRIIQVIGFGNTEVVLGGLNDITVAGATADAFGRILNELRTLFITTTGAQAAPMNGTFTEGGKVVAVRVNKL